MRAGMLRLVSLKKRALKWSRESPRRHSAQRAPTLYHTNADQRQQCTSVMTPQTLYALGTRVRHAEFGNGKVIEKSGSGDTLKVVVLFDTGQWKKLLVKYAALERL